jgi:cell division protein YceG involved in septum cleavage
MDNDKTRIRKEEIATILATTFNWTKDQKNKWISVDTATTPEYIEGVYYPDTYLIPIDETPSLVAKRLVAKFNEKFYSYLPQFTAKNIKWTRALTLASIVQREASNDLDMPLIAGILWNRLDQNMALGVDATLQYLRGDTGKGWWAPINVSAKQIDSPFNTYKYKGLPPNPISNPGISQSKQFLIQCKLIACIIFMTRIIQRIALLPTKNTN